MRVSIQWLRELLPALGASDDIIAERLTRGGLEVEGTERFGVGLEPVLIAQVVRIEPHPEREKLRLVTINRGDTEQRVVCGASNVPEPGGLVALAPLGTQLPAVGFKLEPKEIGGISSEGMLCSESELGLAESASGILVLAPGRAKPGTPLLEVFPTAQDTVLEIGVTPNRPDALGHLGVARDLAALMGCPFTPPSVAAPVRHSDTDVSRAIVVNNLEPDRCPHYSASIVNDVTVGPSPEWLRWRLYRLGVRPISNVVDVTNLLMLLYGQPLHAFDVGLLRKGPVIVRCATPGEALTTLDGVQRALDSDDLVIADEQGPTALAGVMGGEHTEILQATRDVLVECAYFAPRGVRRTARRHGMNTESSFRFERGVDHGATDTVMDHARSLLCEVAGGSAGRGVVHARGVAPKPVTIVLRAGRITGLLGLEHPFDESLAVLGRLGFSVERPTAETASVTVPTWRPDVTLEADLIEEIGRVVGLDRIPATLPPIQPQPPTSTGRLERRTADLAAAVGLSEAICHSFVAPHQLTAYGAPPPVVRLLNPLSEERSVMRTSLMPSLLDVVRHAQRRGQRDVRVFSVAPVYLTSRTRDQHGAAQSARPEAHGDRAALPEERLMFGAVLSGFRPAYLSRAETAPLDVYDAKAVALRIVDELTGLRGAARACADPSTLPQLHPRGAAEVIVGETVVGHFGPLHPRVIEAFDMDHGALIVELDLVAIEALEPQPRRYRPFPRLPAVSRDISLELDQTVAAGDVIALIRDAAGDLCESVELFDRFTGGNLAAGHHALAFHVVYRDPKATTDPEHARTLTDKEVDKQHARVISTTQKQLGATLRA